MDRQVRTELIADWIKANGPDGLFRLGKKSKVSAWTIAKIRTGLVPKKPSTRKLLSSALGVDEDELFPFVRASGSAS